MMIDCGTTVKTVRMLRVNVRKTKAQTVEMETVILIGKSRYNVTCFVYYAYKISYKMFFLSRCF